MNSTQTGFTLWELMTTVAVAGIVLGLGIPSFMELQRNNAMTAAANELVTGILLARAEAVKRQVPVTLCASPDPMAGSPTCSLSGAGTNGGFIVWIDENGDFDADGRPDLTDLTDGNAVVDADEVVLRRSEAPGGNVDVWGDFGYVTYGPNGFARRARGAGTGPATRVLFCDDRGNRVAAGNISTARAVRIEATGRGQVLQEVDQVAASLAIINAEVADAVCP